MITPGISNSTLLNTISLMQSSVKKISHSFSKYLRNITNSVKEMDSNRVTVGRSVFYVDIKELNKPLGAAVVVEKHQTETKVQLTMNTPIEVNKFLNDYNEIINYYRVAELFIKTISENNSTLKNRSIDDIRVSFQTLTGSYKNIQDWSKKFSSLCVLNRAINTESKGGAELLNQELGIFKRNIVNFNLNKDIFDQRLQHFTTVVKQFGFTSSLQTHGRLASDASEGSLYDDTSLSDYSDVIYSDIIYRGNSDSDSLYCDNTFTDPTYSEPIYSDIDAITAWSKC